MNQRKKSEKTVKAVKTSKKRYDTVDKRIKFLKRKGSIVTFKIPFKWKGEQFKQILVMKLQIERKSGSVQIIGFYRDSPWYKSMDELLKAINWEWMENTH